MNKTERAMTHLRNALDWLRMDPPDVSLARECVSKAGELLGESNTPSATKSTFSARLLISAQEEIAPGCFQPYHYTIRVRIDDADWNVTPSKKSLLGTVIGAEWLLTEEVSK